MIIEIQQENLRLPRGEFLCVLWVKESIHDNEKTGILQAFSLSKTPKIVNNHAF